MSSSDTLNDMSPAVRAVAEVRAREAGMSPGEWLEALVYEQAAPAPLRRHVFYGGGSAIQTAPASGSLTLHTAAMSVPGYDNLATYIPMLRSLEFERPDLDRSIPGAGTDDTVLSALRMISAFPPRISHAAILLSAAFAEADVEFRLPPHRRSARHKASQHWYLMLVDTCLHRSREVRNALVHRWTPIGRAERLWNDAFLTLCDLTPARHELLILFRHDRSRAAAELAKHLDVAAQQFELSANLLADVDAAPSAKASEEQRFRKLRAALLERAGGGLSLTEGAKLLGVSRQALHKRIKAGTALGMMDGDEIVLPRMQWIETGGKIAFVHGLADVVRLFDRAGGWSALQFLVDPDPNLGMPPMDALRAGKTDAVVAAARAYLGLDEE